MIFETGIIFVHDKRECDPKDTRLEYGNGKNEKKINNDKRINGFETDRYSSVNDA